MTLAAISGPIPANLMAKIKAFRAAKAQKTAHTPGGKRGKPMNAAKAELFALLSQVPEVDGVIRAIVPLSKLRMLPNFPEIPENSTDIQETVIIDKFIDTFLKDYARTQRFPRPDNLPEVDDKGEKVRYSLPVDTYRSQPVFYTQSGDIFDFDPEETTENYTNRLSNKGHLYTTSFIVRNTNMDDDTGDSVDLILYRKQD
jgi:hypothetical protein